MTLTWRKVPCAIFGSRWELTGLPDGMCANVHRISAHGLHSRDYVACGWIGGRFLSHRGCSSAAAKQRLSREIDRRSIGLFGIDDVTINGIGR